MLFEEKRTRGAGPQPPGPRTRDRDARSVVVRFLLVTLAGYLAALVALVGTVWLAAMPILEDMTREALRTHSETKARAIRKQIDGRVSDLEYVSGHPATVGFITGNIAMEGDTLQLVDRLIDSGAVSVRMVDFSGAAVLERTAEPAATPPAADADARPAMAELFLPIERSLQGTFTSDDPPLPRVLYRPSASHEGHALITLPIMDRGLVEGAITVELPLDLNHILDDGQQGEPPVVATEFQRMMYGRWHGLSGDVVGAQVAGTNIHVILPEDYAAVETQGWALVRRVLLMAFIALGLPFAGMAILGRGAISEPYLHLLQSRRTLEERTREASELAQIVERSHDAIVITDPTGRIVFVNDAFEALTGFSLAECQGHRPGDFLQGPDTNEETVTEIRSALANGQPTRVELVNYHKDGSKYWVFLSIFPIRSAGGAIVRMAAISSDITAEKKVQAHLENARRQTEYMALHDELSGLPNRRQIEMLLASEVGPDPEPRTIVRIDLDHFKAVNDTQGHAAGDHVLMHVAEILNRHVPEGDVAARVGGDEFVILLARGRGAAEAQAMAERLQAEIRKDIPFEGNTCRVGASFGIASAQDGIVSNRDLLVAADAALYTAKDQGRNTTVVYTPAIHTMVTEKRTLAAEIEHAIEAGEFEPHFQPQFDAATLGFAGVEALARWRHPSRGLLAPNQFLGVARELAMIDDIDRIIYRRGIAAIAGLNLAGLPVPKVSFNVGVPQIENPDLLDLMGSTGLAGTAISLEILESVLVEEQTARFAFQVDRLREHGIGIEIDDFGSGHASVVGLMQLRPDAMKLDQRLITPIVQSAEALSIVRNMIDTGKTLGIRVTAEGVATQEHARLLSDLGCDTLQGFHFARPMDAAHLRTFLQDGGPPLGLRQAQGA